MQALHYVERGVLEWRDVPAPVLQTPNDALLRPIAVAACDLDRLIAHRGSPFPGPFVLGHEFCAVVLSVGEGVTTVSPGDQVIASFQPSCGTCSYCEQGFSSVCTKAPTTSMYGVGAAGGDWGGALSEQVRMPWADFNLLKIPEGLTAQDIASGSDNLADGLRAVDEPLRSRPGASVLIAGSGSIPLYAILVARFLGSEQVSFASDDLYALDIAEALGAQCLPVKSWPKRFANHDITFDCTNNAKGLSAVAKSTQPFGVMTIASMYLAPTTPLPLGDLYMKGITLITGRVNSAAQLQRVLGLCEEGLDPGQIKPAVVDMHDAIDAFGDVPLSQKLIFTQPTSL